MIHYGIECDSFLQSSTSAKRPSVIGSIGRLEPLKGHQYLIRAMAHVIKRFPDVQLRILGHDPHGYGRELRSLINELKLEHSVFLLGFESDVRTFLSSIDIFAFASVSEGFGQAVVEAMAAAKPIIVSDIAPLTELVDTSSGIFVPPKDDQKFAKEICWALEHPSESRALGLRARERALSHFSAQRMSDEVFELYRQLHRRQTPA